MLQVGRGGKGGDNKRLRLATLTSNTERLGVKVANRTLISEAGLVGTFQIEVTDRDKKVPAKFNACKNAASFKSYVAGLNEEQTENVYQLYLGMADLKARAQARESVAVESTIIKRDGKEIDLLKLPVEKTVAACNAAFAMAAVVGERGLGPFAAARHKLIEAGKVVDAGGVLSVRK